MVGACSANAFEVQNNAAAASEETTVALKGFARFILTPEDNIVPLNGTLIE